MHAELDDGTRWALPTTDPAISDTPEAIGHCAREVLAWHRADQRKPDSDISVLCWSREDGCYMAWRSDEADAWVDCASGGVVAAQPLWWAEPEGVGAATQG